MPVKTLGKKEKKDFKQEFLDMINKKYGLSNAIVMEKALKTQDKQVEEAMMQGGMTAEQVGQSKGIQIEQKPASSPLGFGGMKQTGENQFTEQKPGFLASLLGTVFTGTPNPGARMDIQNLMRLSQLQRQQQMSQQKGFYQFNPVTGELEQVAEIPKGAEVRNRQVSPQERAQAFGEVSKDVAKYKTEIARESPERVQMASNIDTMDELLTDMEQYLVSNPDAFVKGLVPWQQREFKAILDNYDKTAAIAAGGKQLTRTELQLIQRTRPGLLDTNDPKAIAKKFKILRGIQKRAKERLSRGVKSENTGGGFDFSKTSTEQLNARLKALKGGGK